VAQRRPPVNPPSDHRSPPTSETRIAATLAQRYSVGLSVLPQNAIAYLRRKNRISGDDTSWHIYEAIRPRELPAPARSLWCEAQLRSRLMAFNDSRCNSFAELRAVLIKARIRAVREFFRAAAQTDAERQAEIAAVKAAGAQKEEAAAARKRQLLAELERERILRHAAGDTRETYILCPRPPEQGAPEQLRRAA
jgi:hypothetical protein